MAERWYFRAKRNWIELRSRATGEGVVGDARDEVSPGGDFLGVTYAELKKAKAGIVEIENNKARIVK